MCDQPPRRQGSIACDRTVRTPGFPPRDPRLARAVPLLVLSLASAVCAAAPPPVNGRLDHVGPFRTLFVWGTPHDMGVAHGYLLGDDIAAILGSGGVLPIHGNPDMVDALRRRLRGIIRVPPTTRAELEGMLEGIALRHGGQAPTVPGLGRPLTIDDLVLHNGADLLRAFGCSGFTVWGPRAGDAGVITARTFDFPVTSRAMLRRQMLIVRRPTGAHQVATVTMPGYIGAFTGINDAGVCTFMHDGTGSRRRTASGPPWTPVSLVLKDVLEATTATTAHAAAERALGAAAPYPFSYLIRVVGPRIPGRDAPPIRVFRIDGDGVSENPIGTAACITTNHYLTAAFRPARGADDWSLERYDRLSRRIRGDVTSRAAWDALSAVASSSRGAPTLHAVVVYPERRTLDLALARWDGPAGPAPDRDGAVIPATEAAPPVEITFAQLFGP